MAATPEVDEHRHEADRAGVEVWFEAFADRCYDDDGKLLARSKPDAVHNREKMLAQVQQLCIHGTVTSASGQTLAIDADTLCVHGDNLEAAQAIQDIRALVDQS